MISTHVLDLATGRPAPGINVMLKKSTGKTWAIVKQMLTNDDGRIDFDCLPEPGIYSLNFAIDSYQQKNAEDSFFVVVPVTFKITDTNRKYHVPLLLSPYGYSTYRGS